MERAPLAEPAELAWTFKLAANLVLGTDLAMKPVTTNCFPLLLAIAVFP